MTGKSPEELEKEIKKLKERVGELERRPVSHWDMVIKYGPPEPRREGSDLGEILKKEKTRRTKLKPVLKE